MMSAVPDLPDGDLLQVLDDLLLEVRYGRVTGSGVTAAHQTWTRLIFSGSIQLSLGKF